MISEWLSIRNKVYHMHILLHLNIIAFAIMSGCHGRIMIGEFSPGCV